MKKIKITIAIILIVCVLACGCTRTTQANSSELKNRLIILALGIDKADNDEICVSVQTLNTDVSSNASSQSDGENMVKCYSQNGKSISDAISKLSDLTGKNSLLSQNRIVVFGWDIANDGISAVLDDFIRNNENRSSVLVAVSQEKAKDIIYAEAGNNIIPARMAEQIIESSAEQGYCINTRVYELINDTIDEKSCVTVPLIRIKNPEKESQLTVDKVAVLKNNRLKSVQNVEVVKGIMFACNKVKKGTITLKYADSNVTISILNSSARTKVIIENGKPKFLISVNAAVTVSEINDSIKNKKDNDDFKQIKNLTEKKIKDYVQKSINECIIKEQSDVFGFGRRLIREEPDFYRKNVSDWEKTMINCEYFAEVNVVIKGMGDSAAILRS